MSGPNPPVASPNTLDSLGPIASELIHDLRNEWMVLELNLRFLEEETRQGTADPQTVTECRKTVQRLGEFIRDTAAAAREQPFPTTPFDLAAETENTVKRFRETRVQISYQVSTHSPEKLQARGPRSFYIRALGNLLRNAQAFATHEIHIDIRPVHDVAHISIQDDGPGIKTDILSANPDSPQKGIGIPSVHWTLKQIGGTLHLGSKGQPEIHLPLSTPQRPPLSEFHPSRAETSDTR